MKKTKDMLVKSERNMPQTLHSHSPRARNFAPRFLDEVNSTTFEFVM